MSILELMRTGRERDLGWLREALQAAVELEFFTIPPYLTALWSVKDEGHYAARTIREVVYEEMQHMALACNMLAAVGGVPRINDPRSVPSYPRPLPGGVRPGLVVGLSGLTPAVVKDFMEVEKPENPIIFQTEGGLESLGEVFPTIGAFYEAVLKTFETLQPHIAVDRQISGPLAPLVIEDLASVRRAIGQIRAQGEGTDVSPLADGPPDLSRPVEAVPASQGPAGTSRKGPTDPDLAHYYRFQELDKGRRLLYHEATGKFLWSAEQMKFPDVFPAGRVPAGGYRDEDVADDVRDLLHAFDREYTGLLDDLQDAWGPGGQAGFYRAVARMFSLRDRTRALMAIPIPGTKQVYGPCFRYVR